MYEPIIIEKLKAEHAHRIVDWCRDTNADFLAQWAGTAYCYPLTEQQIVERLASGAEIYEAHLHGNMIATIELIHREAQGKNALVGRFVLDQTIAGKGLGTKVMQTFLQYCKETLGITQAALYVFDFNTSAYRCYQKCGFAEAGIEERPNGWKAVRMIKAL